MKNILIFTIAALVLFTSCSKEETNKSSDFELTTLDSLTHDHATELLRLNILSEYGGIFRQMELYHAEIFDIGVPCDSTIGFQKEGNHTAESETFAIEALLSDNQTIAGNFDDDVYTYGQFGSRSILITKGIAAELDPTLDMYLYFPTCTYDRENITITDVTLATFTLDFRTIDYSAGSPISNRRKYEGEIQLNDNQWIVTFDDGIITTL